MMAAADPLIDVMSLAALVAAGDPPVLLDVRWRLGGPPGIESYQSGHLPGAVYIDLDRDLAGPPGAEGRHPLPAAARFEAVMRDAGVRAGQPVVAYDDAGCTIAARLWWSLRYFGHEQVQLLDGGYRAWADAGLVVTTAEPRPARGDFTATAGFMPVLDAAGAAALARSGVLLDARAAERYRGETEPIDPVAGHIPGALSAPTAANIGSDGRFLPGGELRERFAALGIVPGAAAPPAGTAGKPVPAGKRPGREAGPGDGDGRKAGPGHGRRGLLRIGSHRRTRGSRARAGGHPRRALRGIVVRLGGRSGPPGGHRRSSRLAPAGPG